MENALEEFLFGVTLNEMYFIKNEDGRIFMTPPKYDPISTLGNSIGRTLKIKCKRHKIFTGTLQSYDNHLNVKLKDVEYTYFKKQEDSEEYNEIHENLPEIILRGDSVVYISIES